MHDHHPEITDDEAGLVFDLSRPEAYSHSADPVTRIETHTANVFLAGPFAYKVKKAVDFGFCDFSTREKRRHFTFRELELNQALSDGVYLGVSKVNRNRDGRHTIDGPGETVEHALRMRRLAAGDSLDSLIGSGAVDAATMRAVARRIAGFHMAAAAPGPGTHYWSLPTVRRAVMSNVHRAEEFAGEFVDAAAIASVRGYSDAWLLERGALVDARHRRGAPRECHGDLHAGNIFLEHTGREPRIQVIDCIEFNDNLRIIDPIADIAFLLMDLRRFRRPDLAEAFLTEYLREIGDAAGPPMLPFYSVYRATVRCMAGGLIARSADALRRSDAIAAARSYLGVASGFMAEELPPRLLVVMSGMTGVGKSTVARLLANAWDLEHLQTDVIRKELAGLSPTARTSGGVRRGIYSRRMSQRTYAEMEARAVRALESRRGAVLDGTYLGRGYRTRAVELGRNTGAMVIIVECTLSEESAMQRLAARYFSGKGESEGRPEVYAAQKPQWERVADDEADGVARVNTGHASSKLPVHVFREAWGAALRATSTTRPAS